MSEGPFPPPISGRHGRQDAAWRSFFQKIVLSPLDPFSFGAGAALLLLVAVVACVVSMLRATGVDPAIAVRSE